MSDGFEPITANEVVYRRALTQWYDSKTRDLSPEAFKPTKGDVDGISAWRAKHVSIEQAALGRQLQYYVAVLRALDIEELGMHLVPDVPGENGQRGHCVIPELNYATRKEVRSLELQFALASKAVVRGPFKSSTAS